MKKVKGAFGKSKSRYPLWKQFGYNCQAEHDLNKWGELCEYFTKYTDHPYYDRAMAAIKYKKEQTIY